MISGAALSQVKPPPLPLLPVTYTAVTDAGLFVVIRGDFQQSVSFVALHLFAVVNGIAVKLPDVA